MEFKDLVNLENPSRRYKDRTDFFRAENKVLLHQELFTSLAQGIICLSEYQK